MRFEQTQERLDLTLVRFGRMEESVVVISESTVRIGEATHLKRSCGLIAERSEATRANSARTDMTL
jgi:hypothetical protein